MDKTISWKGKRACPMIEDKELVAAAQQQPSKFEHLYSKWLSPVYRYFYFRLGNIKDAEDLTSQVFLKVYKDLPRYRNKGSFAAWLFTIAHARLVDYYRKDSRQANQEIAIENLEIPADLPELLSQTVQKSEIEQLFKLMNKLKEKEKNLIQLRFIAELSYQEIGRILHCKEDTARKATSRLLEKLKIEMEDDHDEIL